MTATHKEIGGGRWPEDARHDALGQRSSEVCIIESTQIFRLRGIGCPDLTSLYREICLAETATSNELIVCSMLALATILRSGLLTIRNFLSHKRIGPRWQMTIWSHCIDFFAIVEEDDEVDDTVESRDRLRRVGGERESATSLEREGSQLHSSTHLQSTAPSRTRAL
jgi:hypothetical protein